MDSLDGLTVEARPGELLGLAVADPADAAALVGVLAAVVAGILRPTGGQVTLFGTSYDDPDSRAVRDRVVLVSQDVHVFSGTVREP